MLRTWALAAMLVATPVCLLMLIGTQRAYQDRWQRDRKELEQLRALVPDPPPNSIFVPIDIEMPVPVPVTGSTRFDRERRSVFASWWSSGWSVRRAYRRADLGCTWTDWGRPELVVVERDATGKVTAVRTPDRNVDPKRAILFRVDKHSNVSLVD